MNLFNKPIICVLLTAICMYLGWPTNYLAPLLFVGFIPLFFLHHNLKSGRKSIATFWGYVYLSLFLFNISTTWWVWNASVSGALIMLFANSLLMSLPFLLFALTYRVNKRIAYFGFIVYYLAFEYLHFNWTASWPWLTLGKGLAMYPQFIQWYEFTGEMGGSLLILLCNVWIFNLINNKKYKSIWYPATLLIALLIWSLLTYQQIQIDYKANKSNNSIQCVITQPNIDPYTEKFYNEGSNTYIPPDEQINRAIEVASTLLNKKTDLFVLPETAVTGNMDVDRLQEQQLLKSLFRLTDSSKLKIIAGAETYQFYPDKDKPTSTARFDSFDNKWYDYFNTALMIGGGSVKQYYHKAKLVPGVEKMPFPFLEGLSIFLGGASGSLGVSKEPINFIVNDKVQIAPLICYESVYGGYVNQFVAKGANGLAVITNDGWWGETPGHRQHLYYGAIRCIETRREMLRSANTGISAKIDISGKILEQSNYNQQVAFACSMTPQTNLTWYVRLGNFIGASAVLICVLMLFYIAFFSLLRKKINVN